MRAGWEIKKLGEVAVILNGYAFKSEKYENEGVRIIRITNVQKGYITDDDPKFYPAQEEIIDKYKLYPNDLLISLTGNVGRVGLMPAEMLPAALNQRVACIRPITQKLLLRYLFYHLNNSIFEEACIKWSKGLAQKNMSTEWLKEYPLIIPPLSEQKQIVAELDLLNEVIAKKREQLTQLDALAQSIFYDMFGDPITNEKGWETKRLGEISTSQIGITYKPEDVSNNEKGTVVLRSGNIQNSTLCFKDIVRVNSDIRENKYVRDGDILMCSRNGSSQLVGKVAMISNLKERMTYGAFMTVIRSDFQPFLFAFFRSPAFRSQLTTAKTATINQITVKMLENMQVILPPLALQQRFASKIEAIEQQKERIRQSLAEVQQLFDSRMDYYFNEWAE